MPRKNDKTSDDLRLEVAALRLALQKLADSAETVLGDDEESAGYKDDIDECDKAIDEARAVLGRT